MVLGMKSKHKKGVPVKVDYIVHVQEIRPWPPSESLKSVQTVVLQYENSNHNSGSFLSVAGDSNIVFNESFILPIIFYKKPNDKFKKNYLEFSLVEPRKDKAKEQVLGTAILNLADYGVIEDILSINAPLNIKKSSNSISVQPALFITLELIEKNGGSNSSPSVGLSNEAYLDYEDGDDESEVTSYTDDDASSHSSRTFEATMVSPSRSEKNGYYANAATDSSPDTWRKVKNYASAPKFTERSMSYVKKNSVTPLIKLSPSSMSFRDTNGRFNNIVQRSAEDKSFARYAPEILSADIGWEALSEDATKRHGTMRSDTLVPNRKGPAVPPSGSNKSRLNHVMSVQIHDSGKGRNGFVDIPNGSQNKGKLTAQTERKEAKGDLADSKNEWKTRVDMLEEELREVAAIEVGLYSVVAEHASSENKVHAPARRLSRFYTNACRARSQAKRASAARAAVSGLVLVAKSCGNDVTRLTFWLSNSIMLRAIVSQTAAEIEHCNGPGTIQVDLGEHSKPTEDYDDCEDVLTFIIALERVESWLFSRIVESVWWQTFTPHMQPAVGKCSGRKTSSGRKKTTGRKSNLGNNEQGNFSIELWRKAFKDACERLCPMRAGGHECGCLSPLVRLVMEQLVNRLDVAMFNAILRDSAQEMPTDPVSDPITNSKVLPIPAGKSSFSAGAQLKNAIGIWSRWLSDLSGLEDNSDDDSIALGNGHRPKSFKAFRFLHELSNLMMLPFGMLDDASTRKEVCPALAVSIIKRVANSFVPDDFCPDPIPRTVIDALDSEEITDAPGDTVTTIPCTASPTKYSPPPAALLSCVAEVGSQELKSSRLVPTLKKSYTSDDDLDELDSTLTSIVPDSYQTSSALAKLSLMPKHKGGRIVVRYGLLREIWRDDE